MKFAVDLNQCQNLGQCALNAPDLFSLDDDGLLVFRARAEDRYLSGDLTEVEADHAAVAAEMCPMQAISVGDA